MLMHAEVPGDFVERSTSVPSHPRLKTPTKEIITLLSCSFSEANWSSCRAKMVSAIIHRSIAHQEIVQLEPVIKLLPDVIGKDSEIGSKSVDHQIKSRQKPAKIGDGQKRLIGICTGPQQAHEGDPVSQISKLYDC